VAITISNLSNKKGNNSYTFSDLHLDLQEAKTSTNNRNADVVAGPDIIADYDELAIRNEVRNLFTQSRYLNPKFGINLRQYIGQPMSEMSAWSLGQDIERGINLFIPRVKLKKVVVAPDYNIQAYIIILLLDLPNFSKQVMLNASLNNIGRFDFVN
jgi:phage baseplate assembly protein W